MGGQQRGTTAPSRHRSGALLAAAEAAESCANATPGHRSVLGRSGARRCAASAATVLRLLTPAPCPTMLSVRSIAVFAVSLLVLAACPPARPKKDTPVLSEYVYRAVGRAGATIGLPAPCSPRPRCGAAILRARHRTARRVGEDHRRHERCPQRPRDRPLRVLATTRAIGVCGAGRCSSS